MQHTKPDRPCLIRVARLDELPTVPVGREPAVDLKNLLAILRGQLHRVEAATVSTWREVAEFPWRRPEDPEAAADRERHIGRITALAASGVEVAQTALRAIARAEGRLR